MMISGIIFFMTVEILDNFVSKEYADNIVKGSSVFLSKAEGRKGFFEDNKQRVAVSQKEYFSIQPDSRIVDEKNKVADILICDALYSVKEKLENFYGFALNKYEGGLVKLVAGAKNGLHSDMYMLDGSRWNDGSGREDELEYSALLYLSEYNTDFTGGEITFPKQNITLFPKKGTLVFFRGDLDHIHEVKKIKKGSRYALIMFFGK